MDIRLLELLVCPLCKGPLEHLRPPRHAIHELICHHDKLGFAVRDEIPVMLLSEARDLNASEELVSPESKTLNP